MKIKVFEKKDLINKLQRPIEDWKLVSKYQKQFPMLTIMESDDKFPIDGEELCVALGVKVNFNTWLLSESKANVGKLHKYRFKLDSDYYIETRFLKSKSEIN